MKAREAALHQNGITLENTVNKKAGAAQTILINVKICEIVLEKMKKIVEHILGKLESFFKIDQTCWSTELPKRSVPSFQLYCLQLSVSSALFLLPQEGTSTTSLKGAVLCGFHTEC